jgi:integrase
MTANAIREIDLHPNLAAMLKSFIEDRKTALIFKSSTGKPFTQTGVLGWRLHRLLKHAGSDSMDFHSSRRFRATHLRKQRAPEDLIRFWLGHAN